MRVRRLLSMSLRAYEVKLRMKLPSIATRREYRKDEGGRETPDDPGTYDVNRLPLAKELEDVGPLECHWPLNNGNPFLFCGAPVSRDTYCAEHHRRSLQQERR